MDNFIYGERGKIGLIYPATGWIMEPEFYAMAPIGVATYTTRFHFGKCDIKGLSSIKDSAIEAAKLISKTPVDIIAFGCTSGSFAFGKEYDYKLAKDIEEAAEGLPCITTAMAIVDALNTLKAKKISVVTPYIDEVNQKAKTFLSEHGYTVVNIIGMGYDHDRDIDSQDLEKVYRFSKRAYANYADALVLLCTGLRTIPILEMLEKDIDKPVVSAVQATFWKCLRTIGVNEEIRGYGQLLWKY